MQIWDYPMSTTVATAIVSLFIGTHVSISPMFIPMIFSAQIPLQMKGVMLGTGYIWDNLYYWYIVSAALMVPSRQSFQCGVWK